MVFGDHRRFPGWLGFFISVADGLIDAVEAEENLPSRLNEGTVAHGGDASSSAMSMRQYDTGTPGAISTGAGSSRCRSVTRRAWICPTVARFRPPAAMVCALGNHTLVWEPRRSPDEASGSEGGGGELFLNWIRGLSTRYYHQTEKEPAQVSGRSGRKYSRRTLCHLVPNTTQQTTTGQAPGIQEGAERHTAPPRHRLTTTRKPEGYSKLR